MSNRPEIAVIIVNFNGRALTLDCLKDLERQTWRPLRVVVVDNGSTDGSVDAIQREFPGVHRIETGENLGFARGNNVGIRWCLENTDIEYLLLLNNDTESDPALLHEMMDVLRAHSDAAAVGPKIYYFDDRRRIWSFGGKIRYRETVTREIGKGRVDDGRYERDGAVDFVTSCCMLMTRSAVEKVGLLDPNYFICVEDADWCMSARKAGYRILFVHRARLWHKVAQSTGGTYKPFRTFYTGRSNAIFVRKFGTPLQRASFLAVACAGLAAAFIRELFTGRTKAVISKAKGIYHGWTDDLAAPESLPAPRKPGA